jgi:serine/threonine protein kinase
LETRLLASLRHANIVQLRGVTAHATHGTVEYLLMEFANGGSLQRWLVARGALTLAELHHLLLSLLRALVYLHSRSPEVLHRDVKPANVLVFETFGGGIVFKLADVGIAKVLQDTVHAHTDVGTLCYMAPEVLSSPSGYDAKVDVFSTGVMAAELVVRYLRVDGDDGAASGDFALRSPEQRPAMVKAACDRLHAVCPQLEEVIRRCSAVRPRDRMTSAKALRAVQAVEVRGRRLTSHERYRLTPRDCCLCRYVVSTLLPSCGTSWCVTLIARFMRHALHPGHTHTLPHPSSSHLTCVRAGRDYDAEGACRLRIGTCKGRKGAASPCCWPFASA